MKKILACVLLSFSIPAFAVIAVFDHEEISGPSKTCHYTSGLGSVSIQIGLGSVCPMTIDV